MAENEESTQPPTPPRSTSQPSPSPPLDPPAARPTVEQLVQGADTRLESTATFNKRVPPRRRTPDE